MDEAVLGFGLCCTAIPTVAAFVIAWTARGRADEANKKADMTMLRLELLQRQLSALRAAPPVVVEAQAPVAAPVFFASPPEIRAEPEPIAEPPPPGEAFEPQPVSDTFEAPTAPPEPQVEAPPPLPVAPPVPAAPPFEWEKWIGVRGAAVLGGIVFAMAGLYLFKYSIAQGWISPTIRVIGAVLAGLGGLVASQRLRERYEVTGQALGGGGIVVLYAATWASKSLYDLIPFPLAFLLMVLITAVAGVLAVKQDNRLAAYLGLVGGFATPLMLSTGQNAPISLFSYVLFLDVALLWVAYLKRWKSVAALALGGTVLLEFGWVFGRMEPGQVWIAFAVMAVFAVLFAVFSDRFSDEHEPTPASRLLQSFALLTPTVVLIYFASSSTLAVPLAPTAGFLAVLLVGVGFIHRKAAQGEEALLTLSVGAVLTVLALAATSRATSELTGVMFLVVNLGLCAIAVLNVEWPQPDPRRTTARASARWLLAGVMGVLLLAAVRSTHAESHLTFSIGFGVVTLLLVWLGRDEKGMAWQPLVGVAPAVAFAIDLVNVTSHSLDGPGAVDPVLALGPPLVLGIALLGATFFLKVERVLVSFSITTLVFSIFALSSLPSQPLQVLVALALMAALGVVASIRGTLRGAAFATVVLFGLRLMEPLRSGDGELTPWTQLFIVGLGAGLLLHALLFFAGPRFHEKPWGPVALATALPATFPGMLLFWQHAFGRSMQGALAVGLAVVALGSALLAQRSVRSLGSRGVMWQLAAACTLIAIAVPLQLENQWVTISWALMALAYLGLWRRFDSRGLKWLALTLLSFVSIRLLLNPAVLDYHQRSGVLFFNWLTYTYLIPAACLVAAAWLLAPQEVPRARGWEAGLYSTKVPWGASTSAIGAALVVFAWVTLSVFDFFSVSSTLTVTLDRLPARDVALSLSWVVYAVALLAIGMWRRSRALRWMSLGFLLASIGKVFLYDLGELKDLYRVASLMGLAISLIIISLAYQRFVFRRAEPESK